VVGLIVGMVAVPVAAVAATISVVNIAGPKGTKVIVSKPGQLLTAPADPNNFRAFHYYNVPTACTKLYTAPAGSSLILTQVTMDAYTTTSNATGLSTDAACHNLLTDWNPATIGAMVFPFGPGVVIPAGKSLYGFADVSVEVYGYGYLVPVATAPNLTPSIASHQANQLTHSQN
jgi:hypothetical protein